MLLDHIFRNIDEAIDYILVEEVEAFRKDCRRHDYPFQTSDFRQIIDIDSFDNSYSGYFNNAPLDKFIMTRLSNGRYALKPNLKKSTIFCSNKYLLVFVFSKIIVLLIIFKSLIF